jgi:hypothetical protein
MEIIPVAGGSDEGYVALNIIPVPIRQDLDSSLLAAMGYGSDVLMSWSKGTITDRDGGFFDFLTVLPQFTNEAGSSNSFKKAIYEYANDIRGSSSTSTASRTVDRRNSGGLTSFLGKIISSKEEGNRSMIIHYFFRIWQPFFTFKSEHA